MSARAASGDRDLTVQQRRHKRCDSHHQRHDGYDQHQEAKRESASQIRDNLRVMAGTVRRYRPWPLTFAQESVREPVKHGVVNHAEPRRRRFRRAH